MSEDSPTTDRGQDPHLVGDRYELGELLGKGGMAEVHRATDTRLGRPVAIKQLRFDLAGDATFQARFRREAQAAAGLNHPTIVAVYDTGEDTDPKTGVRVPYIVMELVEGVTLRDVLRDGRKILPERALEITTGVLDALSYSHRAGIVHRDIKPANVMLTPAGDVKVMDFGIARAVADTTSTMTQTAAVIGTAQYLSPEQARGEKVDARSDIYSAGCLLYELLVGRPPFVGESPVSVAYQHVREEPAPPSDRDPEVTPGVDAVVMRSLAKDPNERYQSARQMKEDLLRLLNGQDPVAAATVPASSPTPSEAATTVLVPDHQPSQNPYGVASGSQGGSEATRVTEPVALATEDDPDDEEAEPRRTGAIVALVVLLVLALIAVGGAIWWVNQPPPDTTPTPGPSTPSVTMVEVPNVVGDPEEIATNRLKGLGFEVEVEQTEGADDETVGNVVEQDPREREEVEAGSTITITVNVGPEKSDIPKVIGLSEADARRALEEAGFNNVVTEDAESEEPGSEKGTVLEVEPAEGEDVSVSTEIVLILATGEGPVPNFDGVNEERARQDAEEAGFEIEVKYEEVEGGSNTVVSQSPAAGESAEWGSTITVTIEVPLPEPPASSTPPPGGGESTPPGGGETTPPDGETTPPGGGETSGPPDSQPT